MRYIVDTGLPGYGPDASNDSFSIAGSWPDLADILRDELNRLAESELDSAVGSADAGDYETAWNTRVHCDEMFNLADNLSNTRMDAPLYAGRPELWNETVERIVGEHFPYDVNSGLRLYCWQSDEYGADNDCEDCQTTAGCRCNDGNR